MPGRCALTRVEQDDGNAGVEVKGGADVLGVVSGRSVEAVDPDDEGELAMFEVVDRGEAVGEPAGVGKHDRAKSAESELVPNEPEAVLQARQRTRRKQIDLQPVTTIADAIAACIDDVHRHATDPDKKGSLTEAERVRNSARQFLTDHGNDILNRLTERTKP